MEASWGYTNMPRLWYDTRGLRAFPKDPVHIMIVEADLSPREVSWNTLGRKAASYEDGSQ